MTGFEKHFSIKSSDVKTRRFGDDMLLLSNANYSNSNKLVNVIYIMFTIILVINFTLVNIGTPSPKKGSLYTLSWGMKLNFFGDLNLKTEVIVLFMDSAVWNLPFQCLGP